MWIAFRVTGQILCVWKLAWQLERMPILFTYNKGKGSKSGCKNYNKISLLKLPGKVFYRIAIKEHDNEQNLGSAVQLYLIIGFISFQENIY